MIISITHEHDLDGLGSQAIIKRYLDFFSKGEKPELKQVFAHYLDFVDKINNLSTIDSIPDKLIISDIGFNEEFNGIFPILENLKDNGCKILWFDHHIVSDEIKEVINSFSYVYVNDPSRCTAEIVKTYYLPNDSIACKIAELARDSDFKTNKFQLADDLQLIIGYNRSESKNREKRKLVSLLSEGKFQDPWIKFQLIKLKNWYNKESASAINNAKTFDVEDFGRIIISFANISGGKITEFLKNEFRDAKIYLGIDTRFNEIIINSQNVNCRNFAIKFGGGGHKDRAGFKYKHVFSSPGHINPQFVQDVKNELIRFQRGL